MEEKYWIAYYLSFLVGVAVLLALHWYSPQWQENWVSLLASIFGVAFGVSVTIAITVEVVGEMVLLIPKRIKELRAQGRKEYRKRLDEAYRRYGIELEGQMVLPRTPEVEAFLNGEDPDSE